MAGFGKRCTVRAVVVKAGSSKVPGERERDESGLGIIVKLRLLQFHLYTSLKTEQHFSKQLASIYEKTQLSMPPFSAWESMKDL